MWQGQFSCTSTVRELDESKVTTKDVERVLDILIVRDHPLAGEAEITVALIDEV